MIILMMKSEKPEWLMKNDISNNERNEMMIILKWKK